eukprot:NODE_1942_length_1177_cov_8.936190_g1926_i0.p1 GENE.NODE_1942_length_1177_cov_8.936190_g1926_i0~~NODE_1942_length_1177_cov_8.936190_g1926_i0.p1  ORF type:complete len:353 (+),score=47.59 NODE_1942_length_1177_cov_8.936190_g1926_i0:108-1061(+)
MAFEEYNCEVVAGDRFASCPRNKYATAVHEQTITCCSLHLPGTRDTQPVNVLCSYSCGVTCVGQASADCFQPCYAACTIPTNSSTSDLGNYFRRDMIQHVGLTVSNMTASLEFYIDVMGGVLDPNAGGDGWTGDDVQNLLMQKEMLDARASNRSFDDYDIADIRANGTDTMGARYISFGNVHLELLQYGPKPGQSTHQPAYHNTSVPSVVNNMHFALHLHDDISMNEFVLTYEAACLKRGWTKCRCNRIIHVDSEQERIAIGQKLIYNSYLVQDGGFQGWRLAYCKGPDGEQLEMVQANGAAATDFTEGTIGYLQQK